MDKMKRRTWVTQVDEYDEKQILSLKSIRVARLELRETPSSRKQALESLRNWISKNPKIENCRLDATFLLRFLRTKKMSVPLAEENLERYLLLRMLTHTWNFQNLDCNLQEIDELIIAGYIYPAPERDHLGRRIIITNPGVLNPHKHKNTDLLRLHGIAYETILENDDDQVNGVVHFVDGAGVSFPFLTLFTPREAIRVAKNGESTLPMRHKQIIGFNVHPGMKFALDWSLSLISPKMKNRVKIFTTVEETYSVIDKKLLPKEYGGEVPQEEMIKPWKQELQQRREKLLLNDQMKVHLHMFSDKARQGAVSALGVSGQTCNPDSSVYGINGSFRKLEVD